MKRYLFAGIVLVVAIVAAVVWFPRTDGDPGPTLPEVVASDRFDPTPVPAEVRRPPAEPVAEVATPTPPEPEPEPRADGVRPPDDPIGSPRAAAPTAPPPTARVEPVRQAAPDPSDPETQLARIREAMQGAMPRFRICYTDLLREYPDVTDRLLLRLEVAEDEETGRGVPSLVGIESTDLDAAELECFADVLVGLPFPPPIPDEDGNLEPYTITYPVVLTAEP